LFKKLPSSLKDQIQIDAYKKYFDKIEIFNIFSDELKNNLAKVTQEKILSKEEEVELFDA
jgi:hypothetical protein